MIWIFEISRPFHWKPWLWRWRLGWRFGWGWFALAFYRLREDELSRGIAEGKYEFRELARKN